MINSGEAISTPAKKYFSCLARSAERKWARQSILEQENEELKAVASKRKASLSGKRKAIEGKSLITNAGTLLNIRAVEKATKERGQKRRKVVKKQRCNNQVEQSDESEVDLDRDIAILDCIEVESLEF